MSACSARKRPSASSARRAVPWRSRAWTAAANSSEALRHPAHGPAEQAGGVQHQHVLGEEEVLQPEAAADIRAGQAHPLLRHAEHGAGELGADVVDALAAQHEVEAVRRGVVPADGGARLDRGGVQALVHQVERDDVGGAGEGGFHRGAVAALEAEGLVARRLFPDLRRARAPARRGRRSRRAGIRRRPRSLPPRRAPRARSPRRRRPPARRHAARGRGRGHGAPARSADRPCSRRRCRAAGRFPPPPGPRR